MARTWALLATIVAGPIAATGCYTSHTQPDGGGAEDAAPAPPECRAAESGAEGPYETIIRFHNDTDEDLWVHYACRVPFTVWSCSAGLYVPIGIRQRDTFPCRDGSDDCVAGRTCRTEAIEVPPGAFLEGDTWDGNIYTFDETPSGCRCHHTRPAPADRYRVTLPVYDNEADASAGAWRAREVSLDFELPAEGGLVTVPMGG